MRAKPQFQLRGSMLSLFVYALFGILAITDPVASQKPTAPVLPEGIAADAARTCQRPFAPGCVAFARGRCWQNLSQAFSSLPPVGSTELVVVVRSHEVPTPARYVGAVGSLAVVGCSRDVTVSCGLTSSTAIEINPTAESNVYISTLSITGCSGHAVSVIHNDTTPVITFLLKTRLANNGAVAQKGASPPSGLGGGVYTAGHLQAVDVSFTSNTANSGGGIYARKTVIIFSGEFANNYASSFGGAIYSDRDITIYQNSSFISNTAAAGGALYSGGNVGVFSSQFLSNRVDRFSTDIWDERRLRGGAILALRVIEAEDTTFFNNSANQDGGALMTFSNATLKGCILDSNFVASSWAGGGGIVASGAVDLSESSFTNNLCSGEGGAVRAGMGGRVASCRFVNNTAQDGGALYTDGFAEVYESVFKKNKCGTGGSGGALYLSECYLYNSSFIQNNASLDIGQGGAVYCEGKITALRVYAQGNIASNGGAFSSFIFEGENLILERNVAATTGGAVASYTNVTLRNSTLSDNFGASCGAIDITDGSLLMEGCYAVGNGDRRAVNLGGDLGMRKLVGRSMGPGASGMSTVPSLTPPSLQDNRNQMYSLWGGVACVPSDAHLLHSVFTNNTSTSFGGAIWASGPISALNCSFYENRVTNTVEGKGGAIASSDVVDVMNCTFERNKGSKGGAISSDIGVVARGTRFVGNEADQGGGFYTTLRAELLGYNLFTCNRVNQSGGAFYSMGLNLVTDETSVYGANMAAKGECAGYSVGQGLYCGPSSPDVCSCDWTNGHGACRDDSTCVNDPEYGDGFWCNCTQQGYWWPGDGQCMQCSTCGRNGVVMQPCAKRNDTMCRCPRGYTGPDCSMSCTLPPNCTEGDAGSCMFDAQVTYRGVRCELCSDGFFIDSDTGLCVECSQCGDTGKLVQECTWAHDTVCQCPLGKTGINCTADCQSPRSCRVVQMETFQKCAFHRSQYDLNVSCIACIDNYALTEDKHCVPYLTVCPNGTWEVKPPTPENNRICFNCTPPEACKEVLTPCQEKADLVCKSCSMGRDGPQCQSVTMTVATAVVISVCGFAAIVSIAVAWYCYWKRRPQIEPTVAELVQRIKLKHDWADANTAEARVVLELIRQEQVQIPRSQFAILERLGQGAFGTVSRGVVFFRGSAVVCAVKTSRDSLGVSGKRDNILREASMLRMIDHPNVVKLIGVSIEGGTMDHQVAGAADSFWIARGRRNTASAAGRQPSMTPSQSNIPTRPPNSLIATPETISVITSGKFGPSTANENINPAFRRNSGMSITQRNTQRTRAESTTSNSSPRDCRSVTHANDISTVIGGDTFDFDSSTSLFPNGNNPGTIPSVPSFVGSFSSFVGSVDIKTRTRQFRTWWSARLDAARASLGDERAVERARRREQGGCDGEESGVEETPLKLHILLEYMDLGDMGTYLKREGPGLTLACRLWFSYQLASALAYIAERGIIHRDVAARNVLLSTSGGTSPYGLPVAKLSDLGLARLGGQTMSYVKTSTVEGELLPVRWMAPESIFEGVYSQATDVWSYGVTVWEVFSNGETPYSFLQTTTQIVQSILHNVQLLCPENCPATVKDLLERCWAREETSRPLFSAIEKEMAVLFQLEACSSLGTWDPTATITSTRSASQSRRTTVSSIFPMGHRRTNSRGGTTPLPTITPASSGEHTGGLGTPPPPTQPFRPQVEDSSSSPQRRISPASVALPSTTEDIEMQPMASRRSTRTKSNLSNQALQTPTRVDVNPPSQAINFGAGSPETPTPEENILTGFENHSEGLEPHSVFAKSYDTLGPAEGEEVVLADGYMVHRVDDDITRSTTQILPQTTPLLHPSNSPGHAQGLSSPGLASPQYDSRVGSPMSRPSSPATNETAPLIGRGN